MNFIFKKIIYFSVTLFLASTLVFLCVRLAPGDPVDRLVSEYASQEERQSIRRQLGFDRPVLSQYALFLKDSLSFDFGESLFKKEKVSTLIREHALYSVELAFWSLAISTILGVCFGALAGTWHKKKWDAGIRIISLIGFSFPIFSLASILIYFFSIKLWIFPVSEWASWRHKVLPVLTLVIPLSCVVLKVTRARFLDEMTSQWALVLKGKGLSNQSIFLRLVLAILPSILTIVALQLSVVLGGTIVTETIFDIPGLGTLLFEAIQTRDYPLIQGMVIYVGFIYLVTFFIFDLISGKIDPRIVYEEKHI